MRNKHFLILFVIIFAVLVGACTRSKTDAPLDSPSSNDQISAVLTQVASRTPLYTAIVPPDDSELGGGENQDDVPASQGTLAVTPTPTTPLVITATPTLIPTSAPTPALTIPTTYALEKGEFPYCIARRFDIDINALLRANNLSKEGLYKEGLTLTIPKNAASFVGNRSLRSHPTTYTVTSDDTFYRIACKFGDVFPEEIASANGMTLKDDLTIGASIQIP